MQKVCSGCSISKPTSDFYEKLRKAEYGDSLASYSHRCKECDKKSRSLYVVENPDKTKQTDRNYYLKKNYGIDLDQYNQLFMKQNGCCKGCELHQSELKRTLCVDHNHVTKQVRGLLCNECNRAFGMLKENVKTLNNLITYKLISESAVDNTEQEKAG